MYYVLMGEDTAGSLERRRSCVKGCPGRDDVVDEHHLAPAQPAQHALRDPHECGVPFPFPRTQAHLAGTPRQSLQPAHDKVRARVAPRAKAPQRTPH